MNRRVPNGMHGGVIPTFGLSRLAVGAALIIETQGFSIIKSRDKWCERSGVNHPRPLDQNG
jgi:hypothetical protein